MFARRVRNAPGRTGDDSGRDVAAERALLDRVARGDVDALRAAYDEHGGLVYAVAMRVLDDHQLAEECTQDVFLSLWRTARSVDPRRARLGTWLYALARNRAISADRARRARPATPVEDPPVGDLAPDPGDEADRAERAQLLARAIGGLAPEQRQTIVLAFLQGLTHREIAAELDVPLSTVKGRARLALDRLRLALDGPSSDAGGGS